MGLWELIYASLVGKGLNSHTNSYGLILMMCASLVGKGLNRPYTFNLMAYGRSGDIHNVYIHRWLLKG